MIAPGKIGFLSITISSKAALVPEPVSLVMAIIRASLPPTSLQLVIFPVYIPRSCSVVRSLTGFLGWTITTMASRAITVSVRPSPFSAVLRFLDDIPMPAVPSAAAVIPALEPVLCTSIRTSGCLASKALSNSSVIGATEVDPAITSVPLSAGSVSASSGRR